MAVRPTGRAIRVLFDQYVTPLLTELGFNRQQRVYRHHTSIGDSVIVDFQVSSATSRERYQFYINLGLALRTLVEETRGLPPGAELTSIKASECVIGIRLQRPAGWPNDPDIAATALRQLNAGRIHPLLQQGDPTRWSIDTEQSAHTVGLQLVDLLPP